jgi:hypothetical protein
MHEHPELGILPALNGTFIRLADCRRSAGYVCCQSESWQEYARDSQAGPATGLKGWHGLLGDGMERGDNPDSLLRADD